MLRGWIIERRGNEFVYADTNESTAGNRRHCGHCGASDTPEGHDGCLGTLPGVLNACCGHGQEQEAYVQFTDGKHLEGREALLWAAEQSSPESGQVPKGREMKEFEVTVRPRAYMTKVRADTPRDAVKALLGELHLRQDVWIQEVKSIAGSGDEDYEVVGKCEGCGKVLLLVSWDQDGKRCQAGDPPHVVDAEHGLTFCVECAESAMVDA